MPVLLVEPEDFSRQLYGGGGAAVVAQIVRFFGENLTIVGMTSDSHPIGQWTYAEIYGHRCRFLPVIHRARIEKTILISRNLRFAVALAQHRKAIQEAGIESVFSQTWSVLWFFVFWPGKWDICYYYPGLHNSIRFGTHRILGRIVAPPYALIHAIAVRKANRVLAAASKDAIIAHQKHLRRLGTNIEISSLPTATNVELFRPQPKKKVRSKLDLPPDVPIYAYVGRLAQPKCVPFILKAFKIVRDSRPDALLLIVGDGEDRQSLARLALSEGLANSVRFLGMLPPEQVAEVIACTDAGLFASLAEGFSVSMVEHIACGRPIVSTDVSGVRELVVNGKNGFILPSRNVKLYAQRMLDVLNLPGAEQFSRDLAVKEFSMESLCTRLRHLWAPFAGMPAGIDSGSR